MESAMIDARMNADEGQYLSFSLGGEEYGVDILKVREIREWQPVRPLPDTPEYVKGVVDLRGVVVPVIDLRIRFGLEKVEYTPTTVMIVLSTNAPGGDRVFGLVVDAVSDVLDVLPDKIRPAPDLGSRINTRYILGMVSREQRMVILLEMDRLFEPEEIELPEHLRSTGE